MAKTKDIETSEPSNAGTSTVGERLRLAREKKGLNLEDVATQTRIPRRHLEAIEGGDWERLPAPTYTIGFAKSYASAVGVDRNEVGDQVRSEIGGTRPATTTSEAFEAADPARTMPRWLVISAIAAIILVVILFTWLNSRSLEEPQAGAVEALEETPPQAPAASAPAPAAPVQGPVVLTAVAPAWIQVTDQGNTLFQGELARGQSYELPQTATQPRLRAGKPEALRVTVGGAPAPPVGPPGQVASNVSLNPADLMQNRRSSDVTVPAPSAPPGIQNTER
jgi:cytoskeletal protein RodZ